MKLNLQCRAAFSNLLYARLRSFLAILGILIGTASVVAMVSAGEIATKEALAVFNTLGKNLLSVNFYNQKDRLQTPNIEQLYSILYHIKGIESSAPYISLYATVLENGKNIDTGIIGVTQNLKSLLHLSLREGRFISDLDEDNHYCVIGDKVAAQLKTQGFFDALGRTIQIGSQYFTIVGILKTWPNNPFFNQNINQSILIPINSSFSLEKELTLNNLLVSLNPNADPDIVTEAITRALHTEYPELHLYFHSAKQILASMSAQSRIYTILLGLIASISLIVGGIGVMNIMLVSVTERRREIGICMAIGAKQKDIWLMFLVEAVILSLFGGMLGILLGIIATAIIAYLAQWAFYLFIMPIVVGFLVSVLIGIFFGFYPAYQAAKLNPVDTLRSE